MKEIFHRTSIRKYEKKKVEGDKLKFILLKKVGKAMIDTTVTKDEMIAGINEIYFTDEEWDE